MTNPAPSRTTNSAAAHDDRSTRDQLIDVLERLERIEAALGRLVPEPRLTRADRLALQSLLPALYGEYESTPFLARDVQHSVRLRGVSTGWSSKRLGKLFARAAGVMVQGVYIERHGFEGHAVLWRVVSFRVSGVFNRVTAA